MGADFRELVRPHPKESECTGECDNTYRIEERYQRVLSDVKDELNEIKTKDAKIIAILTSVYKMINAET